MWHKLQSKQMIGSPPRVWGNRGFSNSSQTVERFTPTRVGKSSNVSRLRCHTPGSPPRVWGNPPQSSRFIYGARFTPTRVGKSGWGQCLHSPRSVHPHACGEIRHSRRDSSTARGSPPRVWGNQDGDNVYTLLDRFTPTRVGKSCAAKDPRSGLSVHPHACGEICANSSPNTNARGSPPRVWGNLFVVQIAVVAHRFTPTRVGKSQSPRRNSCCDPRFTPTRVGKSVPSGCQSSLPSVHPHACGEIEVERARRRRNGGSPPRVWGNPCRAP